jgi:hypothetical protein
METFIHIIEMLDGERGHAWLQVKMGDHTLTIRVDAGHPYDDAFRVYLRANDCVGSDHTVPFN